VIAALGGSALTGLVAFGIEWWRSSRAAKAALAERRARVYATLLAQAGIVTLLAHGLHIAMETRSGLREGLNVTLGIQKSFDPLDLSERLRATFQPLYEAWSEVWVIGSKEAIAAANDLIEQCGAVMGVATQHGNARPSILRNILGEKWTPAQLEQWEQELHTLALARKRLGEIARQETGMPIAELFTPSELHDLASPGGDNRK